MSVQAITWALESAPGVPAPLVSTLIGLANHAGHDGRGAYPSVATLARYTRKSTRQVQRDLEQLVELGLVRIGDQRYCGHIPAQYRPTVYDLAVELVGEAAEPLAEAIGSYPGRGMTPMSPLPHVRDDAHVTPTRSRDDIHVAPGVTSMSPEPRDKPTTPVGAYVPDSRPRARARAELPPPSPSAAHEEPAALRASRAPTTRCDTHAGDLGADTATCPDCTRLRAAAERAVATPPRPTTRDRCDTHADDPRYSSGHPEFRACRACAEVAREVAQVRASRRPELTPAADRVRGMPEFRPDAHARGAAAARAALEKATAKAPRGDADASKPPRRPGPPDGPVTGALSATNHERITP